MHKDNSFWLLQVCKYISVFVIFSSVKFMCHAMPCGTKTLYGNIEKEIFDLTSDPIRTHRISCNLIVFVGAGMTANFDTPFTGVFYAMEVRAYHM